MNYLNAYNIEDLRIIAQRRLPRVAYDFLADGTEENATLRNNRDVFERIRLQPRTLVDVSARSQQVSIFGKTFRSPVGVAPTGAAGLYGFAADIALARAARDAGVPFVLSTASFEPLEKVALEAAGGTLWFQLYMSKDREPARKLVLRALDAGYEALIVTTDVPVIGNREYNRRNGFTIPFRLNLSNMIDGALHPRWLFGVFLRTLIDSGVPRFRNTDVNVGGSIVSKPIVEFRAQRDALDWDDFRWLRELWPHKLFIKGVLRADDALRAAQYGADGVFISNHGGRQLDGAISPIDALPEIRAAVGRTAGADGRRRFPPRFRHRQGAGARRRHGVCRARDAVRHRRGRRAGRAACAQAVEVGSRPRAGADRLPFDRRTQPELSMASGHCVGGAAAPGGGEDPRRVTRRLEFSLPVRAPFIFGGAI